MSVFAWNLAGFTADFMPATSSISHGFSAPDPEANEKGASSQQDPAFQLLVCGGWGAQRKTEPWIRLYK